jgi:hypothetical protein
MVKAESEGAYHSLNSKLYGERLKSFQNARAYLLALRLLLDKAESPIMSAPFFAKAD